MPPPLLFDFSRLEADRVLYTRDQIYERLPHRYEFMQLDGIVHMEDRLAVAYRDVRPDEWWVRGHVPGRPIFPGVLMLETAAHLSAFLMRYIDSSYDGFVAFGGVDSCKFRGAVIPPSRIYMVCRETEDRPRRIGGDCQAFVNGTMVFEAKITGLPMPNETPA
ncbi:MAG: 3-hydroxyacyl-ACP dehydratase FabZ family protein [Phycisphaerae bacterium]